MVARAPEEARRALIAAYSHAYCDPYFSDGRACDPRFTARDPGVPGVHWADHHKAAGMFLLLRVLFVLPTHYPAASARGFTRWMQPWPKEPVASRAPTTETDLAWPVHELAGWRLLLVENFDGPGYYAGPPVRYYEALAEYDWFAAHFPRRTPEEIEVLEISPADTAPPPAPSNPPAP